MNFRPLAQPLLRGLVFAAASAVVSAANADAAAPAPTAPALSLQAAHKAASDALRAAVQKMPPSAQQKIVGVYVAFHADAKGPLALAACDDDGDYVVVLSDAMLALADAAARAKATDDTFSTAKLDAYARLLAKAQRPGERLLTPPAGFYEPAHATAEVARLQATHFRAILTYLLATEVAHMTAGDLVCPSPTATHERGDDEWTATEHAAALAISGTVHEARRVVTADAHGAALAAEAGAADDAYVALLMPLLAGVEANPLARASMPYLDLHRSEAVRAQIVRTAAGARRRDGKAADDTVRPASPTR